MGRCYKELVKAVRQVGSALRGGFGVQHRARARQWLQAALARKKTGHSSQQVKAKSGGSILGLKIEAIGPKIF